MPVLVFRIVKQVGIVSVLFTPSIYVVKVTVGALYPIDTLLGIAGLFVKSVYDPDVATGFIVIIVNANTRCDV